MAQSAMRTSTFTVMPVSLSLGQHDVMHETHSLQLGCRSSIRYNFSVSVLWIAFELDGDASRAPDERTRRKDVMNLTTHRMLRGFYPGVLLAVLIYTWYLSVWSGTSVSRFVHQLVQTSINQNMVGVLVCIVLGWAYYGLGISSIADHYLVRQFRSINRRIVDHISREITKREGHVPFFLDLPQKKFYQTFFSVIDAKPALERSIQRFWFWGFVLWACIDTLVISGAVLLFTLITVRVTGRADSWAWLVFLTILVVAIVLACGVMRSVRSKLIDIQDYQLDRILSDYYADVVSGLASAYSRTSTR